MTGGSKNHFELIEEINLLKARVRELEAARVESKRVEGEHIKEASFLTAVLDNIEEAIIICDKKGRIIRLNEAARRLHGLSEKPISLEQWSAHYDLFKMDGITPLPKEDIPLFRALKGENVKNAEIVVAPKRKDAFVLVCNGQALIDEEGGIMGALVVMRDITERKRTLEKLGEERTLLQNIADSIFDLVALTDLEGNIKFMGASHSILQYDLEFLIGRNVLEFVHPDDLPRIESVFRNTLAGIPKKDEQAVSDYRYRRADGVYIWLETVGKIIRGNNGEPKELLFCTRDVTDRKRAEEALRNSEEKHRRLFETMTQGVIYQSPDGSIISANPAAEDILGLSFEQMKGKTSHDPRWAMILEDGSPVSGDQHPSMTALKTGKKKGPVTRGVLNCAKNDYVWLSITAIPLFEEGGSVPFQVYATFSDITDQKIAEDEKKKLQAQLTQAQKLESVGRLAGGVAHDFNNMLGIILGHAELALKVTDPSSSMHMDLMEIVTAVHRSAALVKQLLAFARRQTIDPKILDLNESIEKILKMLRRLIGENIDLSWTTCKELWPVKLDPSQLDQILANLSVNARDAISGVGKVTIKTANISLDDSYTADRPGFEPGDYVMLSVSDNGSGIHKDIIGEIFDPFFTTKDVGEGTGLGLATVYGIVKQNNGYINVHSEKGKGSTFEVYLPRYTGKGVIDSLQDVKKPVSVGVETVLVVEDEPTLLPVVKTMLEKSGYKVISAGSPAEAMEIPGDHGKKIDLLLTDVVMPGMNGREFADHLKSTWPDLKVLFMSGYTEDIIAPQRIQEQGVCFLQKPFSMQELALKVREVLDDGGD